MGSQRTPLALAGKLGAGHLVLGYEGMASADFFGNQALNTQKSVPGCIPALASQEPSGVSEADSLLYTWLASTQLIHILNDHKVL